MTETISGIAISIACIALGALIVLIGLPLWENWIDIIFAYWGDL